MLRLYAALLFLGATLTVSAHVLDADGVWYKTIIVKTLDGTTMEYLMDRHTKVTIVKPNLVIETEGTVLKYELESMAQISYGKRFVPTGIKSAMSDGAPFKLADNSVKFNNLKLPTLVELFTLDGKLVISKTLSGNASFSIAQLPSGVYLLKMNNETYKILKP